MYILLLAPRVTETGRERGTAVSELVGIVRVGDRIPTGGDEFRADLVLSRLHTTTFRELHACELPSSCH